LFVVSRFFAAGFTELIGREPLPRRGNGLRLVVKDNASHERKNTELKETKSDDFISENWCV
jgi:hypothetical protein